MEISAFEVYLVLQMDRINIGLCIALFVASVCAMAHFIAFLIEEVKFHPAPYIVPAVLLAVFSLNPSTSTLAAMFIVPPLVNEGLPVVTEEARELYGLAREALEDAVRGNGTMPPAANEENK